VPELYIITGSNGAGKSTVAVNFLPDHIRSKYTVFDGDKLFAEKRKELYPEIMPVFKKASEAANEWVSKHFSELVNDAIKLNDNFVYEGHFREESTWSIPNRFKECGYSINLIFFGVKDYDLSMLRVINRHKEGGHYVSPAEIDLNFRGNLIMLNAHLDLVDNLQVFDASGTLPKELVRMTGTRVDNHVGDHELPDWFTTFLPDLTRKLFPEIKPKRCKRLRR